MDDQILVATLKEQFGYDRFRSGQREAIRSIMDGRDTLIVMPTGAGKSLCYQLPALLREGTTLVVSPLIALMKDQVDTLQAEGLAATFINSSLESFEQSSRLEALANRHWKLCYIAPERLRSQRFREAVAHAEINMLAVDEAHCISQWGHDFRPEYRMIGDFVEQLGRPPVVALTATATPQVQEDIERQLRLRQPYRLVTGFNRPSLRFGVQFTPGDTIKQQSLKAFLDRQPADQCGVIYVGRRREAEDVADFVRSLCGRSTVCYHGGMSGWERESVQEDWMSGRVQIVVATNAFGMGVDKPDVRFVIHYTVPGTLEAYYQEAGRAGRDGAASHCLVLYDPADTRLHEWFIENDAPTIEELRDLYACVRDQARRNGGTVSASPSQLATILDWRVNSKARMGMKLLEQAGLLEDLGEQSGTSQWRLLEVPGRVDMKQPLHTVEQRRALKRRLLHTMMDYAQTHDCRRQYLLDYFGDATPPVADWCCDNCQRQETNHQLGVATSPEEKAPLWVLDAVNHLSYGVGRTLLAKILAGGRGAGMSRYFEHPQYGILRHLSQKTVQRLIDELISERYLQIEAGRYPTLILSSLGREAVASRLAIPLTALQPQPVSSVQPVAPQRVADTLAGTRQLLEEGKTPDEIAIARGLTIGTIFNHLAKLIEQGEISVEQVVNEEEHRLIEQAVKEVGSFYLSPIKSRLPEEISYGEIRCVVAAMQRENHPVERAAPSPRTEIVLDRLMAWRSGEAKKRNQPPYFIFSNAVLQSIAAAMPCTLSELESVRGVGPHKSEQYGEAILTLVAEVAGDAQASGQQKEIEKPAD